MISLATAMSNPVDSCEALFLGTLADCDLPQHAIVRVNHAPPRDGIGIDVQAREAAALLGRQFVRDRSFEIPSLRKRRSITGENLRLPSFDGGHRRSNICSSVALLS